jgi:hypothetical protein
MSTDNILKIDPAQIKKTYTKASKERNTLLHANDNTLCTKVCCICDRIIFYGSEKFIPVSDLEHEAAQDCLSVDDADWEDMEVPSNVRLQIINQYKQHCISKRTKQGCNLNKLMLSPKSYMVEKKIVGGGGTTEKCFGACMECYSHIKKLVHPDSKSDSIPPYAIANGKYFGYAPKQLTRMNEVELAFISQARIDSHLITLMAGSHKSITGWHTLYYTDVEHTSRVMNYYDANMNSSQEEDGFSDDNSSESVASVSTSNSKTIQVVLSGPFTSVQKAITEKRIKVRVNVVIEALTWLKKNNALYKHVNIDAESITQPEIIDFSEPVASENSNIEKVFQMMAVFPDPNEPTSNNGGHDTNQEMKDDAILNIVDGNNTLVARPTKTILKDYEGKNLFLAFPLQFPYGVGDHFGKSFEFYKYLVDLSSPDFHRAEFVTIINNMFQRSKMVEAACLRTSKHVKMSIADMQPGDLDGYIDNYLNNKEAQDGPGHLFMKRLRTITGSLAHTQAAAQTARRNMLAMVMKWGLPSIMFTVTPEDKVNLRIKIMATGKAGLDDIPSSSDNDNVLSEFLIDCTDIRHEFPGLCAVDFQNIIEITISHLIGWNPNGKETKIGLFGDVVAWALACEEQSRLTLHSHFLLWIKNWNSLLDGLGDITKRDQFVKILKEFTKQVLSTRMHAIYEDDCSLNKCNECSNEIIKCSDQGLRELRTKDGQTEFGNKAIVQCSNCKKNHSSDDLAMERLDKILNVGYKTDSSPFMYDTIWNRGQQWSKYQAVIEIHKLRKYAEEMLTQTIVKFGSQEYRKECFLTTALRNLHKENHSRKCFKDECVECRMKIGSKESLETNIIFNNDEVDWYDWRGNRSTRNLFVCEHQRKHQDSFVNIHSEVASKLDNMNSNMITGLSGASIMYVTCYASKNTYKEDTADYAKAGRRMIYKIREEQEELTELDVDDVQKRKNGVRALLGACILTTKSHVVSAPMASYLTRNGSRFRYSHGSSFLDINGFDSCEMDEYHLVSNFNSTYLSSSISNYTCRPMELKDVCVYDFYSKYTTARRENKKTKKTKMEWRQPHPSGKNLTIVQRIIEAVPSITYLTFPDSKSFDGIAIDGDISNLNDDDEKLISMEKYAKQAAILFCPFQNIEDIKTDGKFLPFFRDFISNGLLKQQHSSIMKNAQDCRNSFDAGRPEDPLTQVTTTPIRDAPMKTTRNTPAENDLQEFYQTFLVNMDSLQSDDQINFYDEHNKFAVDTTPITMMGSHKCGRKLLKMPKINKRKKAVLPRTQSQDNDRSHGTPSIYFKKISDLTIDEVYAVQKITREVISTIDGENMVKTIQPNGTLHNIQQYARFTFSGDKDQEKAFVQIASAFVVKLHEKIDGINNVKKRYRSGQVKLDFNKPIYVLVKQGKTDHMAELVDVEILNSLMAFNESEHNETINLSLLNFPANKMIQVKWGTNLTEEVLLSAVKLSSVSTQDKRTTRNKFLQELKAILNNRDQFICFLSGAGGTGKSRVIHAVKHYSKLFCEALGVEFNRRTIVVTGLTGTAAVSINGETVHSACKLSNRAKVKRDDEWENTIMIIVDEVSFITKVDFEKLSKNLNIICDGGKKAFFGGLQIVFAGDFCQLSPPGTNTPLYMYRDCDLWWQEVNTFLELRTNHRFSQDKFWGDLLQRYRLTGPLQSDVVFINKHIVHTDNNLSEKDLPDDIVYATFTNVDRCSINEGIFKGFIAETHSKNYSKPPPEHTICIMASDMKIKKDGTRKTYVEMSTFVKNIIYSSCGDAHVTYGQNGTVRIDPLLKLYVGRPVMLTENIDVENCEANGSMCAFKGLKLKKDFADIFQINIDGYYVRCVEAKNVEYIELELKENLTEGEKPRIIKLYPKKTSATAQMPQPQLESKITHKTDRIDGGIQFTQFPINIANAITVHKLQGRSINNIFASTWFYGGNWIYVLLSRLKTSSGLFSRQKLYHSRTKGMSPECLQFYRYFEANKSPQP